GQRLSFHILYSITTAYPANVEHMLKINFKNYPKGKRTFALLENFLGYRFIPRRMTVLGCTECQELLNIGSEWRIRKAISIIHNYTLDIIRSQSK
ncbi:Cytochrome P450 94C1, partial [Ananas comosus]